MHNKYQSVYTIDVSKVFEPYWLVSPENVAGRLGRSRDRSLPRSARVQANLGGIHAISQMMCAIFQKMPGGFLILCLT